VSLTIHPHLVPRSRMSRSYIPLSSCRLHGGSGTVLLYFISCIKSNGILVSNVMGNKCLWSVLRKLTDS
jgi:hypothetical protein